MYTFVSYKVQPTIFMILGHMYNFIEKEFSYVVYIFMFNFKFCMLLEFSQLIFSLAMQVVSIK